ncbi:phosphatase [Penicillium alfredii]|uniref:Phosphatase n=1 Tax=Penicillium alfredii TaxID=1506179 RepID=A0A9W9KQE4_9EURO|nr:phosphatase [Penicillium alfredii]KAJ5115394.1 phosphatase [Penicillium alfredii]
MATTDGFGSQRVRRLDSLDATRADLYGGPNVVMPLKHLIASTSEHDFTIASPVTSDEEVSSENSPQITPMSTPPMVTSDDFALAFDIDGVFVRGGKAISQAHDAMKYINGENPYGIKVPYIFLTNGGGKTEEERCIDLSRQIEYEVSPGQFICGHTPMREMAERYTTVLVVGGEGEKCRIVAESYGFKDIVTPGDIIKTRQDTTPFRKLTDEEYNNSRMLDLDNLQIEAIFVFADSRDWAGDQQIILDCLMTKEGRLGTRSETFDEGPPVFFSHNDIVWSTSHDYSRIGMGALRASLEALYKAIAGKELNTIAFGKPQKSTFLFATRLLQEWRSQSHQINKPPSIIYFFNDTSDIEWFSILVKTGVYQENTIPRFTPKHICDNIYEAVKFAVEREYQKLLKNSKPGQLENHTTGNELRN